MNNKASRARNLTPGWAFNAWRKRFENTNEFPKLTLFGLFPGGPVVGAQRKSVGGLAIRRWLGPRNASERQNSNEISASKRPIREEGGGRWARGFPG